MGKEIEKMIMLCFNKIVRFKQQSDAELKMVLFDCSDSASLNNLFEEEQKW